MDIKPWEYADFPAFNEPVPGATRVPTTGDKIGVTYHPDVPYATAGTTTLHLQILQEERYLEGVFGEPYRAYRTRVFRYLGRRRRGV